MDVSKTTVAVVVALTAAVGAVFATAHSQRVLQQEQQPYPAGTLPLGQAAQSGDLSVTLDDVEVLDSVAAASTTGYAREAAVADHRFLRLSLSLENRGQRPISIAEAMKTLRQVEVKTRTGAKSRLVWLRGYDALTQEPLAPGRQIAGKVALDVSSFSLAFPFVVEWGGGQAKWAVDVIDRKARTTDYR